MPSPLPPNPPGRVADGFASERSFSAETLPTKTSGLAITSLVLGIVSLGCGCLTGIPGIICGILGLLEIGRSEQQQTVPRLTGRGLAIGGIATSSVFLMISILAVLVALMLPAVQAARAAARRSASTNNLKIMGIGMHSVEAAYRGLPARIVDADGRPLLSWRVAILPFIDEAALYDEFHLDEPWDSPHNIQLLERMPKIFERPGEALEPGMTCYVAAAGPGMIFDEPESVTRGKVCIVGRDIREITDGSSKTVMALELPATDAVPWTKPVDWTGDPGEFSEALGQSRNGVFLVLMADGFVRAVSADVDPDALRAAFSRAGGEFFSDLD
jgi:hypothetical protein